MRMRIVADLDSDAACKYEWLDLQSGDLIMMRGGYGKIRKWGIVRYVDWTTYPDSLYEPTWKINEERHYCYRVVWPQLGIESWVAPYEIFDAIRIESS